MRNRMRWQLGDHHSFGRAEDLSDKWVNTDDWYHSSGELQLGVQQTVITHWKSLDDKISVDRSYHFRTLKRFLNTIYSRSIYFGKLRISIRLLNPASDPGCHFVIKTSNSKYNHYDLLAYILYLSSTFHNISPYLFRSFQMSKYRFIPMISTSFIIFC